METTDKEVCNILVDVLHAHGVRHAVLSPGSRNAPLLVAFARCDGIGKYVIVDERSAAFVALGIAQQTRQPVALVCTSGTALLNYAPAVAEAYYQRLPLVAISADRPKEWIDQDDSQTIRQFEALAQFVKKSYDLPARCTDDTARWYANRLVNDAMSEALSGRQAPVHVNVQLDEPLSGIADYAGLQRIVRMVESSPMLSPQALAALADEAAGKKILVIAGFANPDPLLRNGLACLAALPNVVVLTETIANLPDNRFIRAIDRTLLAMFDEEETQYVPDLLVTTGGAIVSRMVKAFLRRNKVANHWHVGITDTTVDCMQSLTVRIQTEPSVFFSQLSNVLRGTIHGGDFAQRWQQLAERGRRRHIHHVENAAWSDLKAFSMIFPAIPSNCRLQLSNGTTIRYAQLFGDEVHVANFCNRGVSGIDGSTSTALGASLTYDGITLLVTGDMSFGYDLSGLASQFNTSRFKIIVMSNGGGGIFRFISSTSKLPELESYFEVCRRIPVDKYAKAFGFAYYSATNESGLKDILPAFFAAEQPAILAVETDNEQSADALKDYFNKEKQ